MVRIKEWEALRQMCSRLDPVSAAKVVSSYFQITNYPVSPINLTVSLDVECKVQETIYEVEGGLQMIGVNRPIIYLNAKNNQTRQRFTAAHEIGHLVMHQIDDYLDETYLGPEDVVVEQQANKFAANLLAPLSKIRSLLNQRLSVKEIAERFGISYACLNWQMDKL